MFARSLKKINSSRSVSKMIRGVYILTICVFTHGVSVRLSSMRLFVVSYLDGNEKAGYDDRADCWSCSVMCEVMNDKHPVIPQVWYLSLKRPLSDWCLMLQKKQHHVVFFFSILIVRLNLFFLKCDFMLWYANIWADMLPCELYWVSRFTKFYLLDSRVNQTAWILWKKVS